MAFLGEARLQHKNIMEVQRFFKANGTGYIVLRYEQGRTLKQRLDEGPLAEASQQKTKPRPSRRTRARQLRSDTQLPTDPPKLYSNLNYIRVRSFILDGAPLSTHLRTRNGPIPAGQDRSFEHVFATFDADLGIVDLNHVDEGLQIGLAERNRSGAKVLPHGAAELLKQGGIDLDGLG